ncbi:hypothetical protein ACFY0G_45845, partial [Streptomyces sp. NPDC001552]|uniref:hypothetical protein n=1 Tax=Streptomyces sp. NPDC001552 TaxID=3364587 RepID=UPI0036777A3E
MNGPRTSAKKLAFALRAVRRMMSEMTARLDARSGVDPLGWIRLLRSSICATTPMRQSMSSLTARSP